MYITEPLLYISRQPGSCPNRECRLSGSDITRNSSLSVKGEMPMGNASRNTVERRTRYFAPSPKCRAAIDFTFVALVMVILQAPALMAQTGGGATLVGTIKDSSGAVVAGAI